MRTIRVVQSVVGLISFVGLMRLSDNVGYDCPLDVWRMWSLTDMDSVPRCS